MKKFQVKIRHYRDASWAIFPRACVKEFNLKAGDEYSAAVIKGKIYLKKIDTN